MIQPNKLYFAKAHTSLNIGELILLELKGNVSIQIFGSKDEQDTVLELTPQTELLVEDFEYTLTRLPRYVAFVGTADRINIEGYDLTEIKDIS